MKEQILIGNNCLVGFIYRDILKHEYQTPFIWSRIWNDDVIKLLEHYKEINFENFELKKVNKKINNKDNDFYILLDNLVKIFFKHNFFFDEYNEPKKNQANVYYNKIWEYTYNNYQKRTKRMLKCDEKPIIVVHDCYPYYSNEKIIEICKKNKFRCIIFTNRLPECTNSDLMIKHVKRDIPDEIIETYKKEILEFIKSEN